MSNIITNENNDFEIINAENIGEKYAKIVNKHLITVYDNNYNRKIFCFAELTTIPNLCQNIAKIIRSKELTNDFELSQYEGCFAKYVDFGLDYVICKKDGISIGYLNKFYNYMFIIENINQSILQTNDRENEFKKHLPKYFLDICNKL